MLSRMAMSMRNTGIMELMMWWVNPEPMSRPMVQITLSMATSMAPITRSSRRKK